MSAVVECNRMVGVTGDSNAADRGTVVVEGYWAVTFCEECLVLGQKWG